VIHAVGPVWHGGSHDEDATLANAYRRSLELAADAGLDSIAFPSISTGAYGFPIERATRIAQTTVRHWVAGHDRPRRIVLCTYSERDRAIHERLAVEIFGPPD